MGSGHALDMVVGHDDTEDQEQLFRAMIRKPARDSEHLGRVWKHHVFALAGTCEMRP